MISKKEFLFCVFDELSLCNVHHHEGCRMNNQVTCLASIGTSRASTFLTTIVVLSTVALASCGGGSSDSDAGDPGSTPLDDSTNLRSLEISFDAPERLKIIGTALTATVTAGASAQPMEPSGTGFESTLTLPMEQQLLVYVSVQRADDGLFLAAANTTAWLGESGAAISLPEQLFVYDFDEDGDGIDNVIEIERGSSPTSQSLDFDGDGQADGIDLDDDNDGVPDAVDVFPFNSQEYEDTDGDGIGNRADHDDDDDGVVDERDAFPLDASEFVDSDSDNIGDNQDSDADGNGIPDDQEDADNDGVPDQIDSFPDNPYESADADNDGIGDNQDDDDNNNGVKDYREGSQIIIPYVDNASIDIDGVWNNYYDYDTSIYHDEWGKATDNDSYGNYLALENLLIDNTGRCSDDNYSCYNNYMHFQMLHDGDYLYVKIAVEGEQLENWFNDSPDAWQDDSVELYFDVGYDQLDSYGDDDYERVFRFRDTVANPTVDGFYSASGMQTDFVTSYRHENESTDVYQQLYEIRVDLSSIGLESGETFGLEVAANDDDEGGDRDYKWGWWALPGFDEAWRQPSVFGKAKLQPED